MTHDELVRQLELIRESVRERLAEQPPPRIDRQVEPTATLALAARQQQPPSLPGEPDLSSTPHLQRANDQAVLTAPIRLVSRVRVVGPVLTLLRRLARPLVQPILDPYLDRQERFNAEIVRHLNELGDRMERRLQGIAEVFDSGLGDAVLLEARLEAALSDYDAALRQRHTLLFDGLEEELWALQNRVTDGSEAALRAVHELDVKFTGRAQAVDRRFEEKDRAQDERDQAVTEALRSRGAGTDRAEFMETRAVLQELLERARQQASGGTGDEKPADGAPRALDGKLWLQLRDWMADDEYRAFQGQFRGDAEEIGARMRAHVEHFAGVTGPVVDLGCGRGEFMDLLQEAGLDAIGVEINAAEVRSCQDRGLAVFHADLFDWLGARDDESLGGIFLAQVIEHLPPPDWPRFVRLAAAKLRPGGRLLVETINPESLYALARAYVLDPTHVRPAHPELLAFFAGRSGFASVQIHYQAEVPAGQRALAVDEQLVSGPPEWQRVLHEINVRLRRIDKLCCAPQEYLLVATKVDSAAGTG